MPMNRHCLPSWSNGSTTLRRRRSWDRRSVAAAAAAVSVAVAAASAAPVLAGAAPAEVSAAAVSAFPPVASESNVKHLEEIHATLSSFSLSFP